MGSHDEKIIEPSEIIIDHSRSKKEAFSKVNPWLRFLARMFDYSILLLILSLVNKYLNNSKYEIGYLYFFTFLIWIPIEAFFVSKYRATPGKLLLKTKLYSETKKRISYQIALKRSVLVWMRGMGFGLPIISAFTMLFAYSRLKATGSTSWDLQEKISIKHFPMKLIRLILTSAFIVFVFLFTRFF